MLSCLVLFLPHLKNARHFGADLLDAHEYDDLNTKQVSANDPMMSAGSPTKWPGQFYYAVRDHRSSKSQLGAFLGIVIEKEQTGGIAFYKTGTQSEGADTETSSPADHPSGQDVSRRQISGSSAISDLITCVTNQGGIAAMPAALFVCNL